MMKLKDKKLRQAYHTVESAAIFLRSKKYNVDNLLTAIDYLMKRAKLEGIRQERKEWEAKNATEKGSQQANNQQ